LKNCARLIALGWLCLLAAGCDLAYPEVVIVNRTAEHLLIKNPSFSGCVWNRVLRFGDATSPGRCLPGEDRVHFQKLDVRAYCAELYEIDGDAGLCLCATDGFDVDGGGVVDGAVAETRSDAGVDGDEEAELLDAVPTWFNYQTVGKKRVEYGQFRLFEIELHDLEQDFSVPGPYGH